jgi:hypothetical protein
MTFDRLVPLIHRGITIGIAHFTASIRLRTSSSGLPVADDGVVEGDSPAAERSPTVTLGPIDLVVFGYPRSNFVGEIAPGTGG